MYADFVTVTNQLRGAGTRGPGCERGENLLVTGTQSKHEQELHNYQATEICVVSSEGLKTMIRRNLCKQKFQSMCNSRMDVYFAKLSHPLFISDFSNNFSNVISRISKPSKKE